MTDGASPNIPPALNNSGCKNTHYLEYIVAYLQVSFNHYFEKV